MYLNLSGNEYWLLKCVHLRSSIYVHLIISGAIFLLPAIRKNTKYRNDHPKRKLILRLTESNESLAEAHLEYQLA